jgi:hypothetical protein
MLGAGIALEWVLLFGRNLPGILSNRWGDSNNACEYMADSLGSPG